MKTFLVIYDYIPERSTMYFIETDNDDIIDKLLKCHGQLVNTEECNQELMDWLSSFLENEKPIYDSDADVTGKINLNKQVDYVISTGFIC